MNRDKTRCGISVIADQIRIGDDAHVPEVKRSPSLTELNVDKVELLVKKGRR